MSDQIDKLDKRKKKTSLNQYQIYLNLLENDEIFRTGTIPNGLEGNYITEKWKELTEELNTCENGPKLYPEEWKKRLMDWKHTTRSKFRKMSAQLTKDNSTKITITPLEKKAMKLWGQGTLRKSVQLDGIKQESDDPLSTSLQNAFLSVTAEKPKHNVEVVETLTILPDESQVENTEIHECKTTTALDNNVHNIISDTFLDESPEQSSVSPPKRSRYSNIEYINNPTSISTVIGNEDIQNLTSELKRIADIKEQKLRLEIAKFKFNNPGFEFDY